jgi:hypothetical protein
MAEISLIGLDRAEVLAALYNAAKPQGLGFLHADPATMTREEAAELLAAEEGYYAGYFDYLKGRSLKVDLRGGVLTTWLYDRDNGQGAAQRALQPLLDRRDGGGPGHD